MKRLSFEQQQDIQISQAKKMKIYKDSEEFQLFRNTFLAMQKVAFQERIKAMKINSTRENCLYLTGWADAIEKCLEAIDQIISDGDSISEAKLEILEAEAANAN